MAQLKPFSQQLLLRIPPAVYLLALGANTSMRFLSLAEQLWFLGVFDKGWTGGAPCSRFGSYLDFEVSGARLWAISTYLIFTNYIILNIYLQYFTVFHISYLKICRKWTQWNLCIKKSTFKILVYPIYEQTIVCLLSFLVLALSYIELQKNKV